MRYVGGMRMRFAGVFWRGKERDFVRLSFGFFFLRFVLSVMVWSVLEDGSSWCCCCSGGGLDSVPCSILPVYFSSPLLCFFFFFFLLFDEFIGFGRDCGF